MNKKDMIGFLVNHYRYFTMNTWNRSTSYAQNVKLRNLSFPDEDTRARAWELLAVDDVFHDCGVNDIMRTFDADHNWEYQIGFNGRSSGYMVLYQGGRKPSEHKSRCCACGQLNFNAAAERCGKCGSYDMAAYQGFTIFAMPGKGMDMDETFEEWSIEMLRDRVQLVKDFDAAVQDCVDDFVEFARTHSAVKKKVQVPKEILVAQAI
jgi:hypothetical protein